MTARTAIGWPVLQPDQLNTCHVQVLGGVVTLHVRPGDTCTILMDLVRRFDATVERLELPGPADEWTYALRRVRDSSDIWSEHSGGTAIDFNATRHLRGVRGTFRSDQVRAIRSLLDFYEGLIAWGGNFHTVVDEMHFEITAPPGDPLISRIAHKVRDWPGHEEDDMPTPDEIAQAVIQALTHQVWTGDETSGGDALDHRPIAQVGLVGARAALGARDDLAVLKDEVQQLTAKVDQLLAKPTGPTT